MGIRARVGELVQPAVLKTAARKGVRVRIPPRAFRVSYPASESRTGHMRLCSECLRLTSKS